MVRVSPKPHAKLAKRKVSEERDPTKAKTIGSKQPKDASRAALKAQVEQLQTENATLQAKLDRARKRTRSLKERTDATLAGHEVLREQVATLTTERENLRCDVAGWEYKYERLEEVNADLMLRVEGAARGSHSQTAKSRIRDSLAIAGDEGRNDVKHTVTGVRPKIRTPFSLKREEPGR
jgi:predicted nuclease with TOPRIM domain